MREGREKFDRIGRVWYNILSPRKGTGRCANGRTGYGLSYAEGALLVLLRREEGGAMVTYSDLFTYSLVIIGIIGLCMQFRNKKK